MTAKASQAVGGEPCAAASAAGPLGNPDSVMLFIGDVSAAVAFARRMGFGAPPPLSAQLGVSYGGLGDSSACSGAEAHFFTRPSSCEAASQTLESSFFDVVDDAAPASPAGEALSDDGALPAPAAAGRLVAEPTKSFETSLTMDVGVAAAPPNAAAMLDASTRVGLEEALLSLQLLQGQWCSDSHLAIDVSGGVVRFTAHAPSAEELEGPDDDDDSSFVFSESWEIVLNDWLLVEASAGSACWANGDSTLRWRRGDQALAQETGILSRARPASAHAANS